MAKATKEKLREKRNELIFKAEVGVQDPPNPLPTADGVEDKGIVDPPNVNKGESDTEHAGEEMALQRQMYEAIMTMQQKLESIADALMATNEAAKADDGDEDEDDEPEAAKAEEDPDDKEDAEASKSFGMDDVKGEIAKSFGDLKKFVTTEIKKMSTAAAPPKATKISTKDPEARQNWSQLALKAMNDGRITGMKFQDIITRVSTNPNWQPDAEVSKSLLG